MRDETSHRTVYSFIGALNISWLLTETILHFSKPTRK